MRALQCACGVLVLAGVAWAQAPQGNPAAPGPNGSEAASAVIRGRALFEGNGGCTACHRVGVVGSGVGPNLSDAGARLSADDIRKILSNPAPQAGPRSQMYRVTTLAGKTYTGKLLNQGPNSLQMLDSEGQLIAFQRSVLRQAGFIPALMPAYADRLTAQEQADIVAYLASLKGVIQLTSSDR